MANEIIIDFESGNTIYSVVRNTAGQVWYVSGQVFETWGTSGRDADDYDIAMVDKDGDRYVGTFDTNISAGRYTVQGFLQLDGSPDDSDDLIGSNYILWTGSAEAFSTDENGQMILHATGLDQIPITQPAGKASNFRETVIQTWRRLFGKATLTSSQLKCYKENGVDLATIQAVSDDTVTQTQEESA